MHKPPSEHEEWLENNPEPEKKAAPKKNVAKNPTPNGPTGAQKRFKALNDDIHEFG